MWQKAVIAGLVFIIATGCRSPKTVCHSPRKCEPCFDQAVTAVDRTLVTFESGSIEEYVQIGLERNPQIIASQHKIDAIRHRIPQALSLPDPMVSTNTHLAPVQTAAGEQAFSLGVSQKFTNANRRATRSAIVAEEVSAAESLLAQTRLEIAEDIRTACYQLLFIRKSIEITIEDRETLGQISEVVLRQYEVKKSVTQQDVLNVQAEQSKLENQLTELRQKDRSFQARLARLLHIDPNSSLEIVDRLSSTFKSFDVDALIAEAVAVRPDLQSRLADIRRDRKKVCLAQLEGKPDFTVGVNWIATSSNGISPIANGDDALLLGIGFNLPVYKSRIRAGICEAQSNRFASESRYSGLQAQAAEEVFDIVSRLDATRDTLSLVQEDILPKAERTLDLSFEEYATDSIQYIQLISNWRSVLRYRIAEANLQSQYQQLLASLARSIGQIGPLMEPESIVQPAFAGDRIDEQGAEANRDQ